MRYIIYESKHNVLLKVHEYRFGIYDDMLLFTIFTCYLYLKFDNSYQQLIP